MACYQRDIPQHVSSGYFVGVGKTCDLQAVRNWDLKCILVSGGISDQGCVTQKPTWLKSEGRIHRDRALAALEQNQIIWRVAKLFRMGHAAFGLLPLELVRIQGPPLITLNPTAPGHKKQ